MKRQPDPATVPMKTDLPKAAYNSTPQLRLGREIADTTWRIAVPVLLFVALGIFIDIKLDTKPWITLVGLLVGFGFAASLIKRQLQSGGGSKDDTTL